jgi:hypothetical protein
MAEAQPDVPCGGFESPFAAVPQHVAENRNITNFDKLSGLCRIADRAPAFLKFLANGRHE